MIENARSARLAASMSRPLFSSAGEASCALTGFAVMWDSRYIHTNIPHPCRTAQSSTWSAVARDAIAGGRLPGTRQSHLHRLENNAMRIAGIP
jgi:hypothetical protein